MESFDKSLATDMALIDLQKAFDTIVHDILLQKFYAMGFTENLVNWFQTPVVYREYLFLVFYSSACT